MGKLDSQNLPKVPWFKGIWCQYLNMFIHLAHATRVYVEIELLINLQAIDRKLYNHRIFRSLTYPRINWSSVY